MPTFATYVNIPVNLPAAYGGYDLPVDLSLVNNHGLTFSPDQEALLSRNGFVVVPADHFEFYEAYPMWPDWPVYVTTDSVLHIYHLLFDKILRDLEAAQFEPDARALTRACLLSAQSQYRQAQGGSLEESARRALAYFAVADALIDPNSVTPSEVSDIVAAELALINAHAGLEQSPLFDGIQSYQEDYSQYVPRGHYTLSEPLERYFRTMMWYGRINYPLKSLESTQIALLVVRAIRQAHVADEWALTLWSRIYEPTVFFVGRSDDLGLHEYGPLMDQIFGVDVPLEALADQDTLTHFVSAARSLPLPQINSTWFPDWKDPAEDTQGFRFMGQRFVLDAYVFQELMSPKVGGPNNLRDLPIALDFFAALGSSEAMNLLSELGAPAFDNYNEQMSKLQNEIAALPANAWTQNLYWSWLHALRAVVEPRDGRYPAFMRTTAWARKQLHTALASWTELKHDTILYAKQATGGGGGWAPEEYPFGYVEPDPLTYARLLALTRQTHDGLASRGLLTGSAEVGLGSLDRFLSFLQRVAEDELAGRPLDQDDYEILYNYSETLLSLTLLASAQADEQSNMLEERLQAAVVADVATGFERVLEEGVGRVFEIYVVVPDANGELHLAQGGVFSYYEFPWPAGNRLTDEAWREMLEAGQVPPPPSWTKTFASDE
jgi:hypothetical protein